MQVKQLVAAGPLQVAQEASHPQSEVERSTFPVGQEAQVVAEVQVAHEALQAVHVLLVAFAKKPAGQACTQVPLWRKNAVLEQVRQFVAAVPLQVPQEASHPQSEVERSTFPVGQVAQVVELVQVAQEALQAVHVLLVALANYPAGQVETHVETSRK